MQITVKLSAMLTEYLPANAEKNISTLTLPDSYTVAQVIQQLQLPDRYVHLVLVNGIYIEHDHLAETALNEGDVLAIWPPVAGG